MLINKAIPNLFQGVSQQPVSLRLNTQAELQENALSSIVEGLKKRPPTTHVAKLSNLSYSGVQVHTIARDANEKYVVIISNGDLKVYDINGVEKTVNFPKGKTYLNNASPATGFACTTIADHTLISNKSVATSMSSSLVAANPSNTVYFYVAAAPAQHTINAWVDGVVGTATLGTSGGTQSSFASALASSLGTNLGVGYSVATVTPDVIRVVKNSASISSYGVSDSYGGQAIYCLNRGVQQYSHLPNVFVEGFTITVAGDAQSNTDNYYVKWQNSTNSFIETVKPGEVLGFNAATMPHKLVREANGTFTFDEVSWTDRNVGDSSTNANPSFVGRTISDIFFYRNRMGMLSDENVILSKAGKFFTFFIDTVTTIVDSDPIDVAVSSTKVANLRHAIPFNTQLILFSDLMQFVVSTSANVALSQKTITINTTTQYQINANAKPIGLGQDVYFTAERGEYSAVMEYYVQPQTYTNDAAEVTSHVQYYIPKGIYKLIGSSIEDSLFALSSQERNTIFAYKFYWGDESKKLQSSWSKWKLASTDSIIGGEVIDSRLYLVIQRADGVYLEYIALNIGEVDTGMGSLVLLDRKATVTGSYNSTNNTTTWTIPYSETSVQIVLGSSYGVKAGTVPTITRPSSTTVTATGNYSTGAVYVGVPYTMRYRFTEFVFKDDKNVAVTEYALKMKTLLLSYSDSSYFKVEVTPKGRPTYDYKFTGKVLGVSSVLGTIPSYTGTFRVPLMADARGMKVDIVNDTWLQCRIQAGEWNAKVSQNFRRI